MCYIIYQLFVLYYSLISLATPKITFVNIKLFAIISFKKYAANEIPGIKKEEVPCKTFICRKTSVILYG